METAKARETTPGADRVPTVAAPLMDPVVLPASEIAARSARGGLGLGVRTGAVQVLQLASTLLIARLVAPGYYGALTIALAALGFARYCSDLGIFNSFLALPVLEHRELETGALVAFALAVVECAALVLLAPVLAGMLHGPADTANIIRALAVCLVFESLRFGPMVRLNRELSFGRYGTLTLAETAVLYLTQIGLLVAGLGVWALVVGQLARAALGTVAYLRWGGGMVLPRRGAPVKPMMFRALPYQGPAIAASAGSMVFPLVLTASLSATGIGYWGWSTVLATPVSALVTIVSGVTLPTLARLRRSAPARVAEASNLMIRAAIVLPAAAAGLLLGFAHPLVTFVFGAKWIPALTAVEFNLIGVVPATLSFFLAAVLESQQRARERLVAILVAQAVGLALALTLPTPLGVAGAAFASAVAVPLIDTLVLGSMAKLDYRRAAAGGAGAFAAASAVALLCSRLATDRLSLAGSLLLALPPMLLIVWFADRDAARAIMRFGLPLPPVLAAMLKLGEGRAVQ